MFHSILLDLLDCLPEHCAHIICPDDSRSIYEQQSTATAFADDDHIPIALYIGLNDHPNNNKNPDQNKLNPNNNTDNTTNYADDSSSIPNSLLRSKRSLRHLQRRDPIKIVPGDFHIGHLHKREATPAQLEHCCINKYCVCDTKCELPVCAAGEVIVQTMDGSVRPGHCCPTYECRKPSCYSQTHQKEFQHGEKWIQERCTMCECNNGSEQCESSMCKPLVCERVITVKGECCPQCDRQNSPFCPGEENCNRGCKFGYQQSADNCSLCKCIRNHKKANHTTTTLATFATDPNLFESSTPELTVLLDSTTAETSTETPTVSTTTSTSTTTTSPSVEQPPSPPETPWDNHFDLYNDFSSPPIDNNGETDPTIMSIRSYFQEHHLYIIVAASVFTVAMLFGVLVWTYCKFSHKNSYNIVPNA